MRLRSLWLLTSVLYSCDTRLSPYRITSHVPVDEAGFSNALYQSVGVRLRSGHRVELVNNGATFDRLEEEILKATSSINISLFIWRGEQPSKRITAALIERGKAGVACRVLVDAVASIGFDNQVKPELNAAGCEVRAFRPLTHGISDDRNHRKIVVIDGRLAFTGGFGIDEPWLGNGRKPTEWREANVIVSGPAVEELQQAFADNWQEVDAPLLPVTDFQPPHKEGDTKAAFVSSTQSSFLTKAERLTQITIAAATKRLWIANAYFVPSPGIIDLLVEKKRQGVDVRILVPSDTTDHKQVLREQRLTYPKLLEAGVRIWEYQPALMHSKTMMVDDHLGIVGSVNIDRLSLADMEEGALVMSDPKVIEAMERTWHDDITQGVEVKP